MNMKSRQLTSILSSLKNHPLGRIIVLTGARQTGKTTLVRHCFNEYKYLDIEDPVMRTQYASLTASQWNLHFPFAILDEVQKSPSLVETVKSVHQLNEHARFVLLGSAQLLLLEKTRESLAGRCIIQEMYPLTIPELLTESWDKPPVPSVFQQLLGEGILKVRYPSFTFDPEYAAKQATFDYYLRFGGYPALITPGLTDQERTEWLRDYVRTYLERDIRDLAAFRYLEPYVRIQQISALLTGQLINQASLGKEAGVSSMTAQKFLHYLELSYQTFFLQSWSRNKLKRLVKAPKLHYLDPGVQRTITNNHQGELRGNEFESAVVAELFKQAHYMQKKFPFFHLRTSDGREIDLLIETETGYIAIEIKKSHNIIEQDTRHFESLEVILDKPLLQRLILSNDNRIRTLGRNVTTIPAACFLSPSD